MEKTGGGGVAPDQLQTGFTAERQARFSPMFFGEVSDNGLEVFGGEGVKLGF